MLLGCSFVLSLIDLNHIDKYIYSLYITCTCSYGLLNGNKFLFRVFLMEGDVRAWEKLPGFWYVQVAVGCGGGDVSVPLSCTRGHATQMHSEWGGVDVLTVPTHRDSGPYQWYEHVQSDTPNRKLVKTLRHHAM